MNRLKNWLRLLVIAAAAAFGNQSPAVAQCTPDIDTFNNAYWASKPPAVRALRAPQGIESLSAQESKAQSLIMAGYQVDVPIMVWGWDPCKTMFLRSGYGFTWVPNAVQPNVACAPGTASPQCGSGYDPTNPPPGSIRVLLDASNYPPFDPPAPVPPKQPLTVLVGPQAVADMYQPVPGDASPDGTVYTDSRGTFVKHVIASPFGASVYWLKK